MARSSFTCPPSPVLTDTSAEKTLTSTGVHMPAGPVRNLADHLVTLISCKLPFGKWPRVGWDSLLFSGLLVGKGELCKPP